MAESGPIGVQHRVHRRWSFAECVFDEADWSLTVGGIRTRVEAKPLEILRELLLHPERLVRKEQLMDRIWPSVEVVEASLPTAVGKLRRALQDHHKGRPIIETVPGLGYRLAVPVAVETVAGDGGPAAVPLVTSPAAHVRSRVERRPSRMPTMLALVSALVIVSTVTIWGNGLPNQGAAATAVATFPTREVHVALRKGDLDKIEQMLAAGWDPNAPLDADRNNALNILLENCEWNRGHDQRKLLVMARILVDGGAHYADRNAWGDTSYSIASAARYCGPDHPVTKMIYQICNSGLTPAGDRCLADYRRDSSGAVVRHY